MITATTVKSKINLDELPQYQTDQLLRVLAGSIRRAKEDPEYKKQFNEWKKEYRRRIS